MRRATAIIAGAVLLLALAVVIFLAVNGGSWRWGAEVLDASLIAPDVIEFVVDSCHQGAAVSQLRETDTHVGIKVTHQVAVFQGLDCAAVIYCQLQEPLASRTVVDLHTGDRVFADPPEHPFPFWAELRGHLDPCATPDEW